MENRKHAWSGLLGAAAIVLLLASGCATSKPMPLNESATTLDLAKEGVAIFTVRTSNQFKTGYQPNVGFVHVKQRAGEKKELFNFPAPGPIAAVEEQYNEYLVSISLPPGKYKLRHIGGSSNKLLVYSTFFVPVFVDIELKPNKILYLGRIEATLRERKNDSELRGGPLAPLLDQAVSGFSKGTFDIKIYDNYDKDMAAFTQKYPLLKKYTVEKAVLPPWKKPSDAELNE